MEPLSLFVILAGLGLVLFGTIAAIVFLSVRDIRRRRNQPHIAGRMNLKQLETADSTVALSDRDKQIRSWGIGLILVGAVSLANNNAILSSTWGVLLIVVGLMSFYFKDAAMFILYGTVLLWAALGNILSAQGLWIGFGLFQIFWAYSNFRRFAIYRRAELQPDADSTESGEIPASPPDPLAVPQMSRTGRVFPWSSVLLGGLSLGGIVGVFGWAFFSGAAGISMNTPLMGTVESIAVIMGVLALGMGIASVLGKYSPRIVAVLGIITSALGLLLELGLALVSVLAG